MCSETMPVNSDSLELVPNRFKIQEMRDKAVERSSYVFQFLPDSYSYKTKEMCKEAVKKHLYALEFVRDWFVMQEMCKKRDVSHT